MIDIHNHALFGVDDGADTIEESIEILRDEYNQGVDTVILTPHYRRGMFRYPNSDIESNFLKLKEALSNADIGVRILLGCEYHINSEVFDNVRSGRTRTLADTEYILAEYSYDTSFNYIYENIREMQMEGYIPIIAHIERYGCVMKNVEAIADLKQAGALIQINANSIMGMDGHSIKKTAKAILKKGLADIVASDTHDLAKRSCNMKECYQYVLKKYGEKYALDLFEFNARKIVQ